jgi:hypothetical protein
MRRQTTDTLRVVSRGGHLNTLARMCGFCGSHPYAEKARVATTVPDDVYSQPLGDQGGIDGFVPADDRMGTI